MDWATPADKDQPHDTLLHVQGPSPALPTGVESCLEEPGSMVLSMEPPVYLAGGYFISSSRALPVLQHSCPTGCYCVTCILHPGRLVGKAEILRARRSRLTAKRREEERVEGRSDPARVSWKMRADGRILDC
ncbi:hypothetical protein AV530_017710 [Patagioenas fasciata monilis]|uniref:Uncharacterized protein n=1 Tax=Patagioenas fasciata monilis TaxID=372326 RepID=A0A1V4KV55_PATFA|nr:hypothetical protein AV530_017710 [Patagioenas fasciata monilis]